MPDELDLQPVTVTISNHFEGPNFVNGLAIQSDSYAVVSDTEARLSFAGGFDSSVVYQQIVHGTGFGLDASGRYTGTVTSYEAYEIGHPENRWSFEGLDTGLDRLNTLASDPGVTFEDLLLIPLRYDFVGAQFDDVFICGSFDDVAHGFAGNDNFDGLSGDDQLFGEAGSDLLTGGDGDDLLAGGADDDFLFGDDGNDVLRGGGGRDDLHGGAGDDQLRGGAGDDRMRGEAGSDAMNGGGGSDAIYGGAGADALNGAAGDDRLFGGEGGDTLAGGAGADRLNGGGGTNFLSGDAGRDRLTGGSGTDELFGGVDADRLASGSGADFLNGGLGDDVLSANLPDGTGDKAADTFIFEGAFGSDVITDFEVGFDGIILAAGITPDEVTTQTVGDDVLVSVDFLDGQSILAKGVADRFSAAIDIGFA